MHGSPNATSDAAQAYAAGYIEGALTQSRIWNHWRNAWYSMFDGKIGQLPKSVKTCLKASDSWLRSQATAAGAGDPYWGHVSVVLAQLDGLVAG